jgi:hypothetical protein
VETIVVHVGEADSGSARGPARTTAQTGEEAVTAR